VGEGFFWYQLTRVVPGKGPLNGYMCVYVVCHASITLVLMLILLTWVCVIVSALSVPSDDI